MEAVETYLDAMNAQDWQRLATTIADQGLRRSGPFEDEIEGKAAYVAFLERAISALVNYRLQVHRISVDGHRHFVELSELFDLDGTRRECKEVCLFETDADGRIGYVSVFFKTPPDRVPVEGSSAAGDAR